MTIEKKMKEWMWSHLFSSISQNKLAFYISLTDEEKKSKYDTL